MTETSVWDNIWRKDIYSIPKLRIEKAREKVNQLLELVDITSDMKVLDLGSGGGYLAKVLYERTRAQIIGVDSSEVAINIANHRCAGLPIQFILSNVESLPQELSDFDIVLSFGIIEHVKDITTCINEIKRVLKHSGLLFIYSSNKHSFIYPQRRIKEILKIWRYGYQKNWILEDLVNYLQTSGFITIDVAIKRGIGDFHFIDYLDDIISFFSRRKWGRYISYLGRVMK